MKEIKNIKIDVEVHDVLKKYCKKHGLKIQKYLEIMILKNCSDTKDIYGEN